MHGRYEVEDLLKLRASPLCVKPATLPPKEEWMGSVDSRPRASAAKGKTEDSFSQNEGFQKRPTLIDSSRRSTTDPDRIHFGPPRHSFASSNKRNGTHERTKTNEEDDSKQIDRRSATFTGTNGKLGTRDDDMDGFERPRRRGHEEDEADFRSKRDHDRPRWGPRESQSDTPWAKRDKYVDPDERDGPAWRRAGRDRERDRDRDFERADPEPEWVDSTEPTESKTAHTQADFKEWMEQMKKKGAVDTSSHPAQSTLVELSTKDIAPPIERPPPRVFSDSAASVDKFFAKFEEKQTATDTNIAAKPTKSRFASIFGSKEEAKVEAQITPPTSSAPAALTALFTNPTPPVSQPTAAELEQPPVTIEKEKKANDEAFVKLLQMLSKNQAGSAPTPSQMPATKTSVNISELAAVRSPESRTAATVTQANRTPITHTPNLSIDRLIESRSPAQKPKQENPSKHNATPQDLLDLLRRNNLQDKPQLLPQQHSYPVMQEQRMPHPPPGLGNFASRDFDRQPPLISTRREAPRSIYDDPVFGGYRGDSVYQQRSPPPDSNVQGGLGGLFAGMNDRSYPPSNRDEHRAPPMPSMVSPPPGLQRPPPGLDGGARIPQPPPGSGWPPPQQRAPMPSYGIEAQQTLYPQNRSVYQQPPHGPPPSQQQYPIRGDYGRYMQR